MSEEKEELLTFPCDFEVKAMGKVSRRSAPSKSGTYISVTVGFQAQSRAQIDAVYQTLVAEPRILYAL